MDDDDDSLKKTPLVKRLKFGGGDKEKESPFFKVYSNALNSLVSKADVGSSCGNDDAVPTMKEFLGKRRRGGAGAANAAACLPHSCFCWLGCSVHRGSG